MEVRNCRTCGNIFNYVVGPFICPACREALEEKFQTVKEYLREHPGVDIHQMSTDCNVDVQLIRKWLREERLEITSDNAIFLECERCGTSIKSGKYCDKCKYEVMTGLNGNLTQAPKSLTPAKEEQKKSAKMRFLS